MLGFQSPARRRSYLEIHVFLFWLVASYAHSQRRHSTARYAYTKLAQNNYLATRLPNMCSHHEATIVYNPWRPPKLAPAAMSGALGAPKPKQRFRALWRHEGKPEQTFRALWQGNTRQASAWPTTSSALATPCQSFSRHSKRPSSVGARLRNHVDRSDTTGRNPSNSRALDGSGAGICSTTSLGRLKWAALSGALRNRMGARISRSDLIARADSKTAGFEET